MLEYHWKNQVQEMGTKAQNVFMDQLCGAFPRMEMLGDVRCPPAPSAFFVPKSHKRGRVFDPFGEKQPAYVLTYSLYAYSYSYLSPWSLCCKPHTLAR